MQKDTDKAQAKPQKSVAPEEEMHPAVRIFIIIQFMLFIILSPLFLPCSLKDKEEVSINTSNEISSTARMEDVYTQYLSRELWKKSEEQTIIGEFFETTIVWKKETKLIKSKYKNEKKASEGALFIILTYRFKNISATAVPSSYAPWSYPPKSDSDC